MADSQYRKLQRSDDARGGDDDIFIRVPKHGMDILDYLFDMVIPHDDEMKMPDDCEWKDMVDRLAKNR
jgi:hypothetical protein